MKYSYSSLKKFKNCPLQYQQTKVLNNYTEETHESAEFGKSVHAALENYAKSGIALPRNYLKFKPVMDVLLNMPGKKFTEVELALDDRHTPVSFNDPSYMVRGIVDLLIVDGDTAYIFDYKTGSNRYADLKQLCLLAILVFNCLPSIHTIRSGLIFLSNNQFISNKDYTRDQLPVLWEGFNPDIKKLERSFELNIWPPNPSGLCKRHCVVITCSFNGRN
jgi:hypothetical protein